MKLIKQKHSKGCGLAVASMVTGKSYDDIKNELYGSKGKLDGLYFREVIDYICGSGFVDYRIDCYDKDSKSDPNCKIPKYPIHIVELMVYPDSPCCHFIVMDENGKLYDPMFGETEWENYWSPPYQIYGFTKK